MRRHPLAAERLLRLCGVLVAPLLVGCLAGAAGTAMPSAAIDVTITSAPGETLAFEPAEVTVPAARAVALTFRNGSSVSHNLVFTAGSASATRAIVEPGASDQLLFAAAPPGRYPFVCTIHEGMVGALIVEP